MKNIKGILAKLKSAFRFQNPAAVQNPYVQGNAGRKEWNDRYGCLASQVQHWRLAFVVAMGVTMVFALCLVIMALSVKIKPYVVETQSGLPYAIKSMPSLSLHDQRLINYAVNQFITQARTIVADPNAQKVLLRKVFAYSADSTISFLQDYYKTYNPMEKVHHVTVNVRITSSLPLSAHTWQVHWEETERTNEDAQPKTSHWIAYVTVKQGDVNSDFMQDNPFGIFISQLSWSPNQLGE